MDTTVDKDDGSDACRNLLKAPRASVPNAPKEIACTGLVALELVAKSSARDAELATEIAATQAARAALNAPLDKITIMLKAVNARSEAKLREAKLLQRRTVYTEVLPSSIRVLDVEKWRDISKPDDDEKVW